MPRPRRYSKILLEEHMCQLPDPFAGRGGGGDWYRPIYDLFFRKYCYIWIGYYVLFRKTSNLSQTSYMFTRILDVPTANRFVTIIQSTKCWCEAAKEKVLNSPAFGASTQNTIKCFFFENIQMVFNFFHAFFFAIFRY